MNVPFGVLVVLLRVAAANAGDAFERGKCQDEGWWQ